MKLIVRYLKPYGIRMLAGFLIKVMATFMDLGLPWVLAYIIDDVIPLKKVSVILYWGIGMLLLSIGARSFNIIANRMAAAVARNTTRRLRHDLFEKILSLSGAQLDYFGISSLESRMTSDTYNIHNMIGMMQRIGVRAPIILLGGIVVTSTLEPVLTLILLGILPILFGVVYLVSRKGIPLYTGLQATLDKMVGVVRENISGVRVIKALSKGEYEKRRFYKVNSELVDRELKAGTAMALTNPSMNFLLNLGLTLVVVIGAYRVNSGITQPGKIVAFLSYFAIMLQAVMAITRVFVIYSKAISSALRIEEVMITKEDLVTSVDLVTKEADQKERDAKDSRIESNPTPFIEFDEVSFSYTKEPCITNISFQLNEGEGLGIIGSTGSGKTTLINLLMRFYDVEEGAIRIKGKDVRAYDKKKLRENFGVVFQNDVLFAQSVSENVRLGRSISRESLEQAVGDAQAMGFLKDLEKGIDYDLTIKGTNLSGGQKQRLLIARALANHPKILILDDASSALDFRTDSLLRKAIRENYSDTTVIMVAQRISSIMKMDHILVLEDGKMEGYGTHEELLEHCEVYKEIYQSQMMS